MRRWPDSLRHAGIGLAALLVLSGCAATLDLDTERPISHAVSRHADTPLKAQLAQQIPGGESGFHLLHDGHATLAARLSLAQRATRTLDVQSYLFHNDTTGKLVAATLLAAAERGVRVRLLVNDIDTADKAPRLVTLNAHPNIEVRLFNPFHSRSANLLVKAWQALQDHVRLNRRMHNKVFIADNQIGITGGRNIGDEYFNAHRDFAFIDLDVIAAGAIVDALSQSFDQYWNSAAAVPATALPVAPEDVQLLRATRFLQEFRSRNLDSDYGRTLTAADPLPKLLAGHLPWHLAHADLIVDPPEKAINPETAASELLIGQLAGLWIDPAQRALIVSHYFVPGAMGMAYFRYWRHQGVQIDVLTNAYAASDVPIVHTGYANYRMPLLEAGVKLYELKPIAEPIGGRLRDLGSGSSNANLHATTFVFDDTHVHRQLQFRSALDASQHRDGPGHPLAHQVTALVEHAMRPERSYQPRLVATDAINGSGTRLQWHDAHQGVARVSDVEPETSPIQRGLLRVLQALPIEEHL